jgi:arylformamidase
MARVPRFLDVTVPLAPGIPTYPGNPPFELEAVKRIANGDSSNVSRMVIGTHTGTHVDAPVHFLPDGDGAEKLPLAPMIGEAHVVDATSLTADIDDAALRALDLPPAGTERLLFKTRNSQMWAEPAFRRGFLRFVGSGAATLLERGVRLVGIDYLSIGDGDAHRAFLGAGVIALEGLDLREVEPGRWHLTCLPLRLVGSDGAPARAILTRSAP